MPRLNEIKSVLVIGSGPIVIGQACEFDYSGTQACRVLQAEGIRVILINSNPATIMTDPEFADATYVEPISTDILEKIIIVINNPENAYILQKLLFPILTNINKEVQPYFIINCILYTINLLLIISILIIICNK